MKETLIKQMEFENWANTQLLSSLYKADPLDERALKTRSDGPRLTALRLNYYH